MTAQRALHIIWNDRRVRGALIAFFAPFLTVVFLDGLNSLLLSLLYLVLSTSLVAYLCGRLHYRYSAQAWLLGVVAAYSLVANLSPPPWMSPKMAVFSRYSLMLALFHFSEMFFIGITNNENLKPDSFLLNHSVEYWLAATVSWLEFGLESLGMPWLKTDYISCAGVFLCVVGEVIRKMAMWQASSAFTHLIAYRKNKHHSLITDGIYGYMRHPGYVGWFLWSVGTQVILVNPFCLIGYIYVTFRFFEDRIYDEERYLIEFFGRRYINYQREVPCGIPFIEGYRLPSNAHLD